MKFHAAVMILAVMEEPVVEPYWTINVPVLRATRELITKVSTYILITEIIFHLNLEKIGHVICVEIIDYVFCVSFYELSKHQQLQAS